MTFVRPEVAKIGVVSTTGLVSFRTMSKVAKAIQKQVKRDFNKYWKFKAEIKAFRSQSKVDEGYWIVTVQRKIDDPDLGYHDMPRGKPPYGRVKYVEDDWTSTLSHEILEMIVDPTTHWYVLGPPKKKGGPRREYQVEVCDAVEDTTYKINGVSVSDFVTPAFYGLGKSKKGPFSFKKSVDKPFTSQSGHLTSRPKRKSKDS